MVDDVRSAVSELANQVLCSLCSGALKDPLTSVCCYHSFCRLCVLSRFNETNSTSFDCPQCNVSLMKAQLRPNPKLASILSAVSNVVKSYNEDLRQFGLSQNSSFCTSLSQKCQDYRYDEKISNVEHVHFEKDVENEARSVKTVKPKKAEVPQKIKFANVHENCEKSEENPQKVEPLPRSVVWRQMEPSKPKIPIAEAIKEREDDPYEFIASQKPPVEEIKEKKSKGSKKTAEKRKKSPKAPPKRRKTSTAEVDRQNKFYESMLHAPATQEFKLPKLRRKSTRKEEVLVVFDEIVENGGKADEKGGKFDQAGISVENKQASNGDRNVVQGKRDRRVSDWSSSQLVKAEALNKTFENFDDVELIIDRNSPVKLPKEVDERNFETRNLFERVFDSQKMSVDSQALEIHSQEAVCSKFAVLAPDTEPVFAENMEMPVQDVAVFETQVENEKNASFRSVVENADFVKSLAEGFDSTQEVDNFANYIKSEIRQKRDSRTNNYTTNNILELVRENPTGLNLLATLASSGEWRTLKKVQKNEKDDDVEGNSREEAEIVESSQNLNVQGENMEEQENEEKQEQKEEDAEREPVASNAATIVLDSEQTREDEGSQNRNYFETFRSMEAINEFARSDMPPVVVNASEEGPAVDRDAQDGRAVSRISEIDAEMLSSLTPPPAARKIEKRQIVVVEDSEEEPEVDVQAKMDVRAKLDVQTATVDVQAKKIDMQAKEAEGFENLSRCFDSDDDLTKPTPSAKETVEVPTQEVQMETNCVVIDEETAANSIDLTQKPNVLCFSGFSSTEASRLNLFCEKFGCELRRKFDVGVTHLVAKTKNCEGKELCERTMKFFQAMAARVWVISHVWLERSSDAGRLLAPEDFVVAGETVDGAHNGPRRARAAGGAKPLFENVTFYCMAPIENFTNIGDFENMLITAGAVVRSNIKAVGEDAAKGRRCFVVAQDGEHSSAVFEKLYANYGIPIVDVEFVFGCLARYSMISNYDEFVLCSEKAS